MQAPVLVPALDLRAEYAAVRDEIEPAVLRVLASGCYVGGPEVEGLESEFAAACGVPHAAAVHSGTDALRFALMAAGVGPGHEVVTTPFTFIGTTEAISQAGARPVFVDIDADSFTLDARRLEGAITPRTRALLPIHLYGQPADMEAIGAVARRHRLLVVEDACQAHGARLGERAAGALGDAGAFSFYPTKNVGGCGEGGMVTTADPELAALVRRLRDHGQSEKYVHAVEGYNGRLDAVQAAIVRVKLRHLPAWNDRRRALAARYGERLAGLHEQGALRLPAERAGSRHVYHLYAVRIPAEGRREALAGAAVPARDRVRSALLALGIETGIHYPVPLHRQPCYAAMGLGEGSFPNSEAAAREVLTLPLHPQMTEAQVDRVASALERVLPG
jgi:dTDP-4-amino-4,6-dideoxygalactose transaminase